MYKPWFLYRLFLIFVEDLTSFINYFRLHKRGFNISRSGHLNGMYIYRFWWDDNIIKDFPDIDVVDEKENCYVMMDGHSSKLERRKKKRYEYNYIRGFKKSK